MLGLNCESVWNYKIIQINRWSEVSPDEGEGVGHHPVAVVETAEDGRRDCPGPPGDDCPLPHPPGGDDPPLQAGGAVPPGPVQGQPVEEDTVSWLTGPGQQLGQTGQI